MTEHPGDFAKQLCPQTGKELLGHLEAQAHLLGKIEHRERTIKVERFERDVFEEGFAYSYLRDVSGFLLGNGNPAGLEEIFCEAGVHLMLSLTFAWGAAMRENHAPNSKVDDISSTLL